MAIDAQIEFTWLLIDADLLDIGRVLELHFEDHMGDIELISFADDFNLYARVIETAAHLNERQREPSASRANIPLWRTSVICPMT